MYSKCLQSLQNNITHVLGGNISLPNKIPLVLPFGMTKQVTNSFLYYALHLKYQWLFKEPWMIESLGSLSTHVFDLQATIGSELFSFLTCSHTTTPLEISSIKIRKTIQSQHAKCSLPVAVHDSKMCVLKLPNQYAYVQCLTQQGSLPSKWQSKMKWACNIHV